MMAKQNKSTAVPRLRFPEFRDAPGWQGKCLGDVATFFKGKGLPKSEIISDGQVQCIHYGELFKTYSEVITHVISRTQSKSDAFLSLSNDVLMPTSDVTPNGLAKASCIKFENVVLGGDILVIRPEHKKIYGEFLARQIRHKEREVLKLVSGTTVFHLYPSSVKNLRVAYPSIGEQQKIADCLTSMDEVIAAQGRKMEVLKTHKRGLMQQLFPRESKTRPRLRFPEFRNTPEWKSKSLEEVAPLQRGFDLPSTELETGGVPVVYSNGIRGYHKVGMAQGPGLVTGRSGTIGNLHYIEGGDYWPHNTSLWVTTFKGHVPKFVYFLYAAIGLDRFASGSGVPTLNRNDVHSFETRVPGTAGEQQRIADCLSSLDAQITAESNQLAAFKSHKKGLMQQLFPAPEVD
jgi:type I restriction enzyme S subunit